MPDEGSLDSVPDTLLLEKNDLLFNRTNSAELVGKVGIFRVNSDKNISFASYLVRLRTKKEHNPEWLNYLLNSARFWAYARSQALVSLHQANLNSTRYSRMVIPVPPPLEQVQIAKTILSKVAELRTSITAAEREIALMREYRTRLVAEVVTGQLDVRAVAATLPEEPREEDVELAEESTGDEGEPSEFEDLASSGTIG